MKKGSLLSWLALVSVVLFPVCSWAGEAAGALRNVEQYNFSIHIMAMLLVGFGFLMVFVKKYGYSATNGTYLVVAALALNRFHRPNFCAQRIKAFRRRASRGWRRAFSWR